MATDFEFRRHPCPANFPAKKKYVAISVAESVTDDDGISKFRRQVVSDERKSDRLQIWVTTNPRGAERLPPEIVVRESDFYLRRLWRVFLKRSDLTSKPKYLVTFTVGYDQKANIDACVKKVNGKTWSGQSELFMSVLKCRLMLSSDADISSIDDGSISVFSGRGMLNSFCIQTLWLVMTYECIFIWDEDIGVEHFNVDFMLQLFNLISMFLMMFFMGQGETESGKAPSEGYRSIPPNTGLYRYSRRNITQ
ncbi:hypothetical protein Cgig2_029673 [Carnegiea gigantea]|uniref:Uncharacterized protein n=1 Tax=Carnegiea gigantea TaxID=171969 RepID=A0A9Q1KI47_9CARY|nr:hypothetical protein Cgig2_029673 [Carnegiea gigantea]